MTAPSTTTTATDLWADAVGQDRAAAQLRASAASPVHAFLLAGQEGWGARAVARAFAADLLTAGLDDPGEVARICHLVAADEHADVITVEAEGGSLRDPEVDELVRLAHRRPTERPHKVLVVPRFDTATDKAWSRLLKVLEEPPASTVWVLLADDLPAEMATVTSRASVVRLDPVAPALVAARLVADGHPTELAEVAAAAAAGDLVLARLLVADERLGLRCDAWRRVPDQLDGTGHVVWRLVAELGAAMDDALEHLRKRFDAAEVELAARVEELGLPQGQLKDQQASHKRQLRRARTAELRLGLATLAARYRDALATSADRAPLVAAVGAVDEAYEALLVRNAREPLQLQALLLRLPPLVPAGRQD